MGEHTCQQPPKLAHNSRHLNQKGIAEVNILRVAGHTQRRGKEGAKTIKKAYAWRLAISAKASQQAGAINRKKLEPRAIKVMNFPTVRGKL